MGVAVQAFEVTVEAEQLLAPHQVRVLKGFELSVMVPAKGDG